MNKSMQVEIILLITCVTPALAQSPTSRLLSDEFNAVSRGEVKSLTREINVHSRNGANSLSKEFNIHSNANNPALIGPNVGPTNAQKLAAQPKTVNVVPPPSPNFTKAGEEWKAVSSGNRSYPTPLASPKFDLHGNKGQLTSHFQKATKN